jgi:hypothetical protein
VAWDRDRPVPWKRLLTFVGIYSMIVLALFAILKPGQILQSAPGLLFGAGLALVIMAALTKFGWQPTMLKSKAEIAAAREERQAAKARTATAQTARSSKQAPATVTPDGPRPKPPPTKRTTPGATNNPRRTRETRKR